MPAHLLRLPGSGALLAVDASPTALASAIYLWLPRGAASEREDEQGLAHLLEHMLFKGAGGHGVSEAAARIEGLGGDLNAFTSYEQTVLHATVPAGREALAIALLCEMAFSPRLDPEELEREKGVVVEEIRGAADDPTDLLAERLRARLHHGHPYGRPILGTEATVRALTAEGMRRFHRAHHRPGQAMLVVAGPVDAAEIQAAAAAAFNAADPGEELAPPPRAPARPQPGAFVLRGFEERTVELAWAIPGLQHEDLAALDLLSSALGDGDSAVLSRRLRDELGLAVDAWAALESEPDRGVLVVGAHARPGKTAACARALMEEVRRVAVEGLPVAALRRARRGILTSRIWERETVDGRAARLAWYLASFGDAAEEQRYEARIQAVRAEDVRLAAARWLRPEEVVAGAVVSGRELSAARLAEAVRLEPVHAPIPDPRPSRAFVRRVLSCGAVLVIEPDPAAEVAALSLVGVGGSLLESARTAGLSSAWSAVVTRGAGDLDAASLAAEIEDRAGSLRAWRARNSLGLELRFPEAAFGEGLDLLGEILLRPAFPPDELARALDDMDEAREGLLHDDPGSLAWTLAWEALYPGHPWGRSSLGTARSIRRITQTGLRTFHRRSLVGSNLVLGVAGAVEPDEVVARLERVLRRLPAGQPVPASPPTVGETFLRRRRRRSAREQAHLVMAFPAVGHGDPRAPTQRLLEGVLGGQSGRLFLRVREQRGLAYDVSASASEGLGGGTLLVSAAVDAQRRAEAWAAIDEALAELREQPLGEEELERVKARVVDGAVIGMQRAADRAGHLAAAERYGPGAEHWRSHLERPRAVDAAQLQALARELLRPDRRVEVEVVPERARGGRREA